MEAPPENDCCSICHEGFTFPCQANCSHWFCGDCILRVWHHGSALQPLKCPICRLLINLLIPCEASTQQHNGLELHRLKERIVHYNRLFSGESRSLMQRLKDLPFFLGRLSREFMDPQRSLPMVFRARTIFAVLFSMIYILSPVDILPEGVLGLIGFFDDFLVLLFVFLHLAALYRSLLLYRHASL